MCVWVLNHVHIVESLTKIKSFTRPSIFPQITLQCCDNISPYLFSMPGGRLTLAHVVGSFGLSYSSRLKKIHSTHSYLHMNNPEVTPVTGKVRCQLIQLTLN